MADPALAPEPGDPPAPRLRPLPAPEQPAARPGRRWARRVVRVVLLGLVPLAVLLVGVYFWAIGGRYIETDNAYVRADKVAISPEIDGRVVDVAVSANDVVVAGDPLFRIDDEPFRIALGQSEAQLTMVRTEIAVLRANYRRMREQLTLAETDAAYFEQEYRRQAKLAERKVTAAVKVDGARHQMNLAIQQVAVRERELGEVLARLGGDPDTPDEQFARFINARERRDRAALGVRNTVVRAPADGIIGQVALRPGTFVRAGEPVISLVETADFWLEANLKESDLTHVAVGQSATVRIDVYPSHEWQAKVVSLSPATGAEFTLLPPQNATGNWVKVVQRIPVRLRIVRHPGDPPLRVGTSATVIVDTGYERPLPRIVAVAKAWLIGDD